MRLGSVNILSSKLMSWNGNPKWFRSKTSHAKLHNIMTTALKDKTMASNVNLSVNKIFLLLLLADEASAGLNRQGSETDTSAQLPDDTERKKKMIPMRYSLLIDNSLQAASSSKRQWAGMKISSSAWKAPCTCNTSNKNKVFEARTKNNTKQQLMWAGCHCSSYWRPWEFLCILQTVVIINKAHIWHRLRCEVRSGN